MFYVRKSLALALAVAMTAALGTGCGAKKGSQDGAGSGNAKVAVSTAAIIGDVTKVALTISAGTVSATNPAFPDITATLTKGAAGNVWTANVTNIPAGDARLFKAVAYQGTTPIYEGSTTTVVTAGATA